MQTDGEKDSKEEKKRTKFVERGRVSERKRIHRLVKSFRSWSVRRESCAGSNADGGGGDGSIK